MGGDATFHALCSRFLPPEWIHLYPPIDARFRANCAVPRNVVRPAHGYLQRDHRIVDETEGRIACPQLMQERLRSGIWATVQYARKLGRPVWIVWPDGTVTAERVPGE